MRAALISVLIVCSIWKSEQKFHSVEPGLYADGNRIDGDEVIYEKYDTFSFYGTEQNVTYPSKNAFASFYKITRIEFKDYGNDYRIDPYGRINEHSITLQITKNDPHGQQPYKVWIFGKYVGPCKRGKDC